MEKLTLANGIEIPCMGFGCYNAYDDVITSAVQMALEAGYRYIDSAEFYKNEAAVGAGLASYAGDREELFVLSKIWPSFFEDVAAAFGRTSKDLQTEYLDSYIIHWPGTDEKRRLSAYEQLLGLAEKGLVRAPGVSNFSIPQLEKIREEFGAYPFVHEIECHPSYQQRALIDWCRERKIQVISYEPLNRTKDMALPAVEMLAEKYGKSPAQIVLRWHVQHNQIPIPKSGNRERIRENIALFDFELSEDDMEAIDALETGVKDGQDAAKFPAGY